MKFATSIVDYLFRVLAVEYLGRYDLAHVKPDVPALDSSDGAAPKSASQLPASSDEAPALSLNYTREALARTSSMAEGLEAGARGLEAPTATTTTLHPGMNAGPTGSPLDAHLEEMMGDAPVCDVCGHITVRNGACYKCLNCGNSMGCS